MVDHGQEKLSDHPGLKRVWLVLALSSETVDLFHNGAGGYRAQFYLGVRQGEDANRCVIDAMLGKLEGLCATQPNPHPVDRRAQ